MKPPTRIARIALRRVAVPREVRELCELIELESVGQPVERIVAVIVDRGTITIRTSSGATLTLSRNGALTLAARLMVLASQ